MNIPGIDQTWEITPRLTRELLSSSSPPLLIDCREPDEHNYCRIAQSQLIPLSRFAEMAQDLVIPDSGAIIYCHHGIRSMQATRYLRNILGNKIFSMSGGIERWSLEIDPSIPRY